MRSTKLWIADSQESYARAFMEYVNLKKGHLFQVRMCTEAEGLIQAFAEEEIELLLLTADWYEVCKEFIKNECIIFLSEGSLPKQLQMYPAVYKYQSVENMLRELMYYYSEQDREDSYFTRAAKDNKVIGVYSPVREIEKTTFTLALGQILAAEQNVLYLNLEECSGLSEIFLGNQWNLSDLIYFLRQNKTSFLHRLNSMIQKLNGMDYLAPCSSYLDFQQITVEEWQQLLYLIRTQSSYDVIVLDFGNILGQEVDLLRQCDGIYVLTHQDIFSQARLTQWERHIQILDGMDILEKIQKLELPICEFAISNEEDIFSLPQQKLGQYIQGLLQE